MAVHLQRRIYSSQLDPELALRTHAAGTSSRQTPDVNKNAYRVSRVEGAKAAGMVIILEDNVPTRGKNCLLDSREE
ncbi:MAG: hypothetical protein ACRDGM_01195 [bacterium]